LIIEDDPVILANLHDFLETNGHVPDTAADGVTGLHRAVTGDYDVIVLDLGLPGMNGLALCRRLREDAQYATPILMLTARDTLEDKLSGFQHGADDYLVKPFALKELEARLLALHRRHRGRVAGGLRSVGALSFDPQALTVRFEGAVVKLTPKCMRLVECMISRPNHVFSRRELESAVWGGEQETSATLRSHLRVLRQELVRAGGYDPIENIHGIGYRLLARRPEA
jgi:DNA-binding response OmpR family regulator